MAGNDEKEVRVPIDETRRFDGQSSRSVLQLFLYATVDKKQHYADVGHQP